MPQRNQYFYYIRKSYIQDKVDEAKNSLTNHELEKTSLDDIIIQEKWFMEDDDILKSIEFKSSLYKVK